MSNARATSLLKPYLRKLVLQTHPDFFQRNPTKGKQNAQSLQRLYAVLNPILNQGEPNDTIHRAEEPMELKFYSKRKDDRLVTSTFDPAPPTPWHTVASLFQLCKQLDIQVQTSDEDACQAMIDAAAEKNKRRSMNYKSLRAEFARAFYENEQKGQQHDPRRTGAWTRDEILMNRQLTFASGVNRDQFASMLSKSMPQLQPRLWWGQLPILVVPPKSTLPSPERVKGILIFSSDMDTAALKDYLEAHLTSKKQEYQELFQKKGKIIR
ncbi:hypothetical protein BX666DRAFT_1072238 [Dichotomocladium elegans]|nr:hypothetical protein BX666DRAFT_1072238 [Dichotomocladium elegans]